MNKTNGNSKYIPPTIMETDNTRQRLYSYLPEEIRWMYNIFTCETAQ